jgi:hypothetical protein
VYVVSEAVGHWKVGVTCNSILISFDLPDGSSCGLLMAYLLDVPGNVVKQ